jgi:hypothetical protein
MSPIKPLSMNTQSHRSRKTRQNQAANLGVQARALAAQD